MYWRLKHDTKNYKFLIDNGNIYSTQDFLHFENGKPIDQIRLRFRLDRDGERPVGSFIPANRGILVSTSRVFEIFKDEIKKSRHRFYQGEYELGKILILSIFEEVSGFDFVHSTFLSFDDGDIYDIQVLRLTKDFHTDLDIFRLKDNYGTRFELIVSNNFKNKYERNNLSGLIFESTA